MALIPLETQRDDIIRPVDAVEWYYGLMSYRGLFGSVELTSRYTKPVTKPEIIRALKSIILKNPWLLANIYCDDIKGEASDCVWKYIEKVDLNDVVEFQYLKNEQEEDPDSPLNSELVSKMIHHSFLRANINKTDVVLWKVVVLNDVEVCFIYDHGLLDGRSGQSIQLSIFETLRELENVPLDDNMITTIGRSDLPEIVPHINNPNVIPYKGKLSYLLWAVLLPMLPHFLRPKELRYTPAAPPIPVAEQAKGIPVQMDFGKGKVELLHLTAEETQNIINVCKKNKSSVTSFINQAGIEAVSKVTGVNKLRHQTPLDARKCISPSDPYIRKSDPRRILGFYTSIFDSYYDRNSTETFWQKVIRHTEEIKRKSEVKFILTRTLPCLVYSFLFPNTYKFLDMVATDKREYTMWLSNLGYVKFDYKEESKFNIERMDFMSSAAFNAIIIDVVTTNNNGSPVMSIYLHDGPNSLEDAGDLRKLKDLLRETITDRDILMLGPSDDSSKSATVKVEEKIL